MKKIIYILLIYTFLSSSFAFANVCGLLELENGDLLEINRGKVYDIDQAFLADSVPAVKRVNVLSSFGSGYIEKNKGKGNLKQIKTVFSLKSGKKLTMVVNQAGSLVFFDASTESFVHINIQKDTVSRARLSDADKKLKFVLSENEFFSKDLCY